MRPDLGEIFVKSGENWRIKAEYEGAASLRFALLGVKIGISHSFFVGHCPWRENKSPIGVAVVSAHRSQRQRDIAVAIAKLKICGE